ncbi:hypothetical protein HAX54_014126 [Datura stramonium]|uniref:Uncharacterized protein n=1 Tax=Datura stramonium TaxID=4076 RepID=A0ABS8Y4U1_DATST|nr:hypothetical protein [Datura stramonium]
MAGVGGVGVIAKGEVVISGEGSDDVPSSVPSIELTIVSGIVPPKFSSSCLGSEGMFIVSVSKRIPSFRAGALTYSVEDGTRRISCSSSFSYKSILTKRLNFVIRFQIGESF